MVDVADVEPGALAREATRAQGGETPLAGQLRQGIRLVHELGELASAEELLHGRRHRPDVDQGVGSRLVDLLDRHPLADHALHAEQPDAERVLDQLAVGADAPVPEVVDVVRLAAAIVEDDQLPDDRGDVLAGDGPAEMGVGLVLPGKLEAHPGGDRPELLVELVAPDAPEVVAAEVEEEALHELPRVVAGGRIARAQLLVDLDERLGLGVGGVLVQRGGDVRVLGIVVEAREHAGDLFVALVAHRAQERGRRDLALAVDLHREQVAV